MAFPLIEVLRKGRRFFSLAALLLFLVFAGAFLSGCAMQFTKTVTAEVVDKGACYEEEAYCDVDVDIVEGYGAGGRYRFETRQEVYDYVEVGAAYRIVISWGSSSPNVLEGIAPETVKTQQICTYDYYGAIICSG